MEEQSLNSYYSFHLNRSCLFCCKPIADQAHAAIKFCRRKVLPDGSVGSCKDDFHAAKRKKINPPFNKIAKHHKLMHQKITLLFRLKGETVTLEDVNRFGITLHKPVSLTNNSDGSTTLFFVEYSITKLSINQYKIKKHGLIL
jgi:hypothetical protein